MGSKYYTVVHKGGHHQVWCNGEQHIKTYFSCTENINNLDDVLKYDREFTIYKCDCNYWKEYLKRNINGK